MTALFIVVLGLVVGSFIGALTWRYPRRMTILGRSLCPQCHSPISWYDNIPLVSYLVLSGRCRSCRKRISIRYPLIEGVTALVFLAIWQIGEIGLIGEFRGFLGEFTLPFFLAAAALFIAIAVVDLEHMIIPDKFVWVGMLTSLVVLLFAPSPTLFIHLFWASLGSLAILALNFLTRGKGMGLGDVKLVFLLGLMSGRDTPLSLFLAVLSGAILGLILVFWGRARMRSPIPFGPFLIFGTFVVILFGDMIRVWLDLLGLKP